MVLPESYQTRMRSMLGSEYDAYVKSLERPAFHGLRINTAKISVEEFLRISPFDLKPVPWCETGFYYADTDQPTKHPYYYAGLYYVQEPSAMLPAAVLPIEEGDKVLDVCAAPGGKSTALAAKLNGSGLIVSNDISFSRAKALLKNMELFGISNMLIMSEPVNVLSEHYPEYFDKILIDAPCSGEGMFRKSASMVKAWETNGVPLFVNLQQSILTEIVKCLAPGGKLVYSTCTFSPEENEQEIEFLLSLDPTLEIEDLPMADGFEPGHPEWGNTGNEDLTKTRRLFPHRIDGEGHFVTLVKKKDGEKTSGVSLYPLSNGKVPKEVTEFLADIRFAFDPKRLLLQKERLYYIPKDMPDIRGIRMVRQGLFLGEVKKNRFEPSQSLAMALKKGDYAREIDLPVSDERILRYLKGETIEVESDLAGTVLLLVDGYPLGWGKINKGTIKNKYLAGWRYVS